MKKKNKIILWIIFFLVISTIITTMYYDYNNLRKKSARAEAVITNVVITEDSDGDKQYQLEYKFEADNKTYSGEYSSNKELSIGDVLYIRYEPKNPENNCEVSEDNSVVSSVVSFISVFILLCELMFIERNTVNNKKISVEQVLTAAFNMYKLILRITLTLLIITILLIIYSINHEVMISIKIFTYFSTTMMLIVFAMYFKINKTISKIKNDSILLEEIKNSKEIKCDTTDIYFSRERLIEIGLSFNAIYYFDISFNAIYYSDIILMSMKEAYDAEALNSCYILLITKDLKKHFIAPVNIRNFENHEIIMNELRKRVPNILEGYTKENQKIIEEMKMNKSDV